MMTPESHTQPYTNGPESKLVHYLGSTNPDTLNIEGLVGALYSHFGYLEETYPKENISTVLYQARDYLLTVLAAGAVFTVDGTICQRGKDEGIYTYKDLPTNRKESIKPMSFSKIKGIAARDNGMLVDEEVHESHKVYAWIIPPGLIKYIQLRATSGRGGKTSGIEIFFGETYGGFNTDKANFTSLLNNVLKNRFFSIGPAAKLWDNTTDGTILKTLIADITRNPNRVMDIEF